MPLFMKNRWVLFLVLIVFVALKYPHLYYPFYWDECWPYASAVKHMYEHGPSLYPGAIDAELSRGHPMLFHFCVSLWMKLFGVSNFAMHSFMLCIAVLFIVIIYELLLRFFDKITASFAIVLVAFHQIYFVQSSFLLPEVMLAFLSFTSVYFYCTRRYLLTALSLTLLFYTKESGLVLGVVLGIDAIANLLVESKRWKDNLLNLLSLYVPLLFIVLFFVLQKRVQGWYTFPLHSDAIETNWDEYFKKYKACIRLLFVDDYRYVLFIVVLISAIISALVKRNKGHLMPVFIGVVVCLLLSENSSSQIWQIFLLVLFNVFFLMYAFGIAKRHSLNMYARNFVMLSAGLIVAFIAYTALFFIIDRYMIIALVPLLVLLSIVLVDFAKDIRMHLYTAYLLIVGFVLYMSYTYCQNLGDTKLGAFDGMYVQQDATDYIEQGHFEDSYISIYENLQWLRLNDFYTGFRKRAKPYKHVMWGVKDSTEIVMLENIETTRADDSSAKLKQDSNFILVHRAERGLAWSEVFIRKAK